MSDETSDNMADLWNRDAFGVSTIMYYCKTGLVFGGSSNKRTSNILVQLGDNITFRFDPIQRTLFLQKVRFLLPLPIALPVYKIDTMTIVFKNNDNPVLIERNISNGQYYPVATFYKPLDHC